MRIKLMTATLALVLLATGVASAQTGTTPNRRQGAVTDQKHPGPFGQRVRQGVRAGTLTREELARLRQRLSAIRDHAKSLRQDGTFSRDDRQALRRDFRGASRMLFLMKRNRVGRGR